MASLFKKYFLCTITIVVLHISFSLKSQSVPAYSNTLTPGGANSMLFKFTKQVWLNPTIILAKQNFEQSTNVKLLILPRLNANDTTGSSRIEKAFDKLLSFLVYKENVQGSIKFYFNPHNPTKPFTFNVSDEIHCKFTPLQKDTVEQILNLNVANSNNLNNFALLPFDSIINQASRYCKKILQSKPGQCGPNPENEFTLTKINSTPAKINFERTTYISNINASNGGVDKQKYAELAQNYNNVLDVADNSNYGLAWKAIEANKTDKVKIKLKKKQGYFDPTKLVFKNAAGNVTYNTDPLTTTDSSITFNISGQNPGTMAEVVAYYTPSASPSQTFAIGAFNAQFYQSKTLKLVLVNLNSGNLTNPTAQTVQDSLNKIYSPVFIKWQVSTANCALPGNISKNIHIESSGLLSNYMPDMQPIVSYFKNNCTSYNSSADDTYYLLFGAINDGSLLGYMPRGRNTGFIFNTKPQTIAHELGHGAFNLKHIFSSDELGEANRYLTDNLMDYNNSATMQAQNNLYKHQWELIHEPASVSWFGGDDDNGASVDLSNMQAIKSFSNVNGSYTFITPAGKYITLPKGISALRFSSLDHGYYSPTGINSNNNAPFGSLIGFTDEYNNSYSAVFQSNFFGGYQKNNTAELYIDDLTATINPVPQSGIVVLVGAGQNQFKFYAGKFSSTLTSGTIDPDKKGSGTIANGLLIIEGNTSDLTKTLSQFLNAKRKSSAIVTIETGANYKITNVAASPNYEISNQNYTLEDLTLLILNENSSLHEILSHFAFVNQNQAGMLAFAVCLEEQNSTNQINILKSANSEAAKNASTNVSVAYTNREQLKTIYIQLSVDALLKRTGGDTTLLHDLKMAQTIENVQDAFDNSPNATMCSLHGLTISRRIALLNVLLNNGTPAGSYWYGGNKFIIKELIESTPQTDELAILNAFKTNSYRWFRTLWDDYNSLTNSVSLEDLGELFGRLNEILAHNVNQFPITPHTSQKTFYTSLTTQQQLEIKPGLDLVCMLGLKDGLAYGDGVIDKDIDDLIFNSDGSITIHQKYDIDYGYSVILQRNAKTTEEYNETYSPFEPVTVKITKYFPEFDNEINREITMPAYMAAWYIRSIDKVHNDRIIKYACNTALVLTAVFFPPSAIASAGMLGASAAILTDVAALAAVADIYVDFKKSNMNQQTYNIYKPYFDTWNHVKMSIDIANLGVNSALMSVQLAAKLNHLRLIKKIEQDISYMGGASAVELEGLKNATEMCVKTISNQEVIASANAIMDSKILAQGTKSYIDFDLKLAGRFFGHDGSPYTAAIFKTYKAPNAGVADDVILLTNGPKSLPKTPSSGGSLTSSVVEAVEVISEAEADLSNINLQADLLQGTGVVLQKTEMVKNVPLAATETVIQNTLKNTSVQVYTLSQAMAPLSEVSMLVLTQANGQKKLIYVGQAVYNKLYERTKNKQQCKVCKTVPQLICQKFENLQTKVGPMLYNNGISKLCSNLTPGTTVNSNSVLDHLIAMNTPVCQAFLTDIVAAPTNSTLSSYINTNLITKELIETWEIINEAKTSVSINYRRDKYALIELVTARSTPNFTTNIGNSVGIIAVLKANKYLPCKNCQNNNTFLQKADEYIKDLVYFSSTYNNSSLWQDLKQPNAIKIVYGAAFQLRILRAQSALFSGGTVNFDQSIMDDQEADNPGDDDPDQTEFRSKCRYDIKVVKAAGNNFFEFKSWSSNFVTTFLNTPSKRTGFTNQLKTYLSSITNLSQLKYIFDGKRISETQARDVLTKAFRDNPGVIYDLNPGLFNTIEYNNIQVTQKSDFITFVNSQYFNTSAFLNFVKTL